MTLRILELFCGLGGWSKPWLESGHDVTGVDIENLGFPGKFIQADLFDWEPKEQYDIVLASPPCNQFSKINAACNGRNDERQGLDLVYRTFYLISKIKPKYFVIENVQGLGEFLPPPKDKIRYTRRGKWAFLWGNFPNLGFFPEMIYHRHHDYSGGDPRRGLIPYTLAKEMMDQMTKGG